MHLGDGVKVGAHSILRDVKIAAGSAVAPFSLIESTERREFQLVPTPVFAREPVDNMFISNTVEVKNKQASGKRQTI